MTISEAHYNITMKFLELVPCIGKDLSIDAFIEKYKFACNLDRWRECKICFDSSWLKYEGEDKIVAIVVDEKSKIARYVKRNGQVHKTGFKETEIKINEVLESIDAQHFKLCTLDQLISNLDLNAIFRKEEVQKNK